MNRHDLTLEEDAAYRRGYADHHAGKSAPDDPHGKAGWHAYAEELRHKAEAAAVVFKPPPGQS